MATHAHSDHGRKADLDDFDYQTTIGIYQTVAYHATQNFRDPETFDPTRWMENPYYADDRREIFKPFGLGPKSCIAKQ